MDTAGSKSQESLSWYNTEYANIGVGVTAVVKMDWTLRQWTRYSGAGQTSYVIGHSSSSCAAQRIGNDEPFDNGRSIPDATEPPVYTRWCDVMFSHWGLKSRMTVARKQSKGRQHNTVMQSQKAVSALVLECTAKGVSESQKITY